MTSLNPALRISCWNTYLCYARRNAVWGSDTPLRYGVWEELRDISRNLSRSNYPSALIRLEAAEQLFGSQRGLVHHVLYRDCEPYNVHVSCIETRNTPVCIGVIEAQIFGIPLCFPSIVNATRGIEVRYTQPAESFNFGIVYNWRDAVESRRVWDLKGTPDIIFAPGSFEADIVDQLTVGSYDPFARHGATEDLTHDDIMAPTMQYHNERNVKQRTPTARNPARRPSQK